MTTLVALASKHCLVMGTDSLGTTTRGLINPYELSEFFDPGDSLKLRLGDDNKPVLTDLFQLIAKTKNIPHDQLLHVNKLFRVGTLPLGVAFAGITSIGPDTIRGLIAEFADGDRAIKTKENYAVQTVARRLLAFLWAAYQAEYAEEYQREDLELLVGGYDRNKRWPVIVRIDVKANKLERTFGPGEFGIAFGGQKDWIQRIVFGTDTRNLVKLRLRTEDLLNLYREKVVEMLQSDGYNGEVPSPDAFGEELQLFHEWGIEGLGANWAEFSEQNAIDCVDFFLDIMIRAQDVSPQLPTVGGNIHIVVIRKDGYYPVTKEVWRHGEHEVPIPEVGR